MLRFAPAASLAATAALVLGAALLPVPVLALTKRLVDRVAASSGDVTTVAVVLATLLAGERLAGLLLRLRLDRLTWQVGHGSERQLLERVAAADLARFDDPVWHDRLARAREGVEWRSAAVCFAAVDLVSSTLALLGIFGLLAVLSPILLLLALLAAVPVALAERRASSLEGEVWARATPEERRYHYLGTILSVPRFAAEVRAFGLAGPLLERHRLLGGESLGRLAGVTRGAERRRLAAGAVAGLLIAAAYGVIAGRGLGGAASAGTLAATVGAFTAMVELLRTQVGAVIELGHQGRFLTDLFAVLGSERLVSVGSSPVGLPVRLDGGSGGISFEGVRFAYPGSGGWALDGCDLSVAPGEVLALVGDNGAGKTTLVRLLLRLYDPQGGCVRLGGVDLREADPDEVRSRVGVLFSDFATYQLSVRDNVGFGRVERPAADEAVWAALSAAAAVGVAEDLGGLDANAGRLFEGGHDLSGGQWQRLALARLCFRDAMVWVLDEPTAALDPEAEAEVFGRLREWLAGRTGIVISHRFSTVRQADRIAVLERGRVVEYGTHDELVARGGRYATMFELQAANYR